jgi:hypothetical protein
LDNAVFQRFVLEYIQRNGGTSEHEAASRMLNELSVTARRSFRIDEPVVFPIDEPVVAGERSAHDGSGAQTSMTKAVPMQNVLRELPKEVQK